MHQRSPLRYTTSKSQSWIPWCRRLPLPRPAVREKEITNEWPFRQGLQSWSWWLSDWVARGKTWHVMESSPTSDEFFFCKQRNTLDELLGCFSINNWLDELFLLILFPMSQGGKHLKTSRNSPETDVNHWVMKILFVKAPWLCVGESHPCMNLSTLLPVENDLNVGVCASVQL